MPDLVEKDETSLSLLLSWAILSYRLPFFRHWSAYGTRRASWAADVWRVL